MMSEENDSVTLNFGDEDDFRQKKTFKHPVAVFFHLVFRVLAILYYFLCGLLGIGFITNVIVVVLLLSMDFWAVKNITGRLLVGLRWWNQVDEEGKSQWVYEARKHLDMLTEQKMLTFRTMAICRISPYPILWSDIRTHIDNKGAEKGLVNSAESRVFWLSLVATVVIWVFFVFSSILSLKYLMLSLVGVILNGANLYGYVRCKFGSRESVQQATTSFLSKHMFKTMFQAATSSSTAPGPQSQS